MIYRDGWKLINRFGYWCIFDGGGRFRGRRIVREDAYNAMYDMIESKR